METLKEIQAVLKDNQEIIHFYFYTPFCGTCKAAGKMLDVLQKMTPELTVYRCNINRLPALAQTWRIESVPCLIKFRKDSMAERLYAFRSVEDVYHFLKC